MTLLARRLKRLREDLDLTQETLSRQSGIITAPGWVKLESGQREPSEKLITRLVAWMVLRGSLKADAAAQLRRELLLLKYLGSLSAFVRGMAGEIARETPWGQDLLAQMDQIPDEPARRGRPRKRRPARV